PSVFPPSASRTKMLALSTQRLTPHAGSPPGVAVAGLFSIVRYRGLRKLLFVQSPPGTNALEDSLSNRSCKKAAYAVKIGTCGFGLTKEAYARFFRCVEIQQTFYQPPQIKTLERRREQMPADFEFILKAWQLITHAAKSPTYRRLKRKLSDREKQEAGYFRDTAIVNEAWETTVASAKALRSQTILFQCPASFTPTEEHVANMERFFCSIEREHLNLCWEPRGD